MGITLRQFEQMQSRTKRVAAPVFDTARNSAAQHTIILGIDPSLRGTGIGIIQTAKPHSRALAHQTIRCPAAWERSRCLVRISAGVRDAIREWRPTVCIIESLFYAQNFQTALIMGEARGASLVAAAEAGLEILELAPRKVKQAIVGYGAAQKSAVAKMVQRMLNMPEPPEADAADALALAIAYAQSSRGLQLNTAKRI